MQSLALVFVLNSWMLQPQNVQLFKQSGVDLLMCFNWLSDTLSLIFCCSDDICTCILYHVCYMFCFCCLYPRGLARQKLCTQALSLISLNTLNAFLHNFLIIPFSHHVLLDTHNQPLLIALHLFHTIMVFQNTPFSHTWLYF